MLPVDTGEVNPCGVAFIELAAATAAAARLAWCRNCSDMSCSMRNWCWASCERGNRGPTPGTTELGGIGMRNSPKGLLCMSGGGNRGWCLRPGGANAGPLPFVALWFCEVCCCWAANCCCNCCCKWFCRGKRLCGGIWWFRCLLARCW